MAEPTDPTDFNDDDAILEPAWLLAPPQDGDFKLLISRGEGTVLPDNVERALDDLLAALQESDFVLNDDMHAEICAPRTCNGKCSGLCASRCSGRCGSNCPHRRSVATENQL